MKSIINIGFAIATSLISVANGYAQTLPANTCGIVYTYDAAGNRTIQQYVCNNSPMAAKKVVKFGDAIDVPDQTLTDALYPNPTTGKFIVTFTRPIYNATITIFNVEGKVVQSSKVSGNSLSFDISLLPSGTYFLRATDGQNIFTHKIVKRF